MRRSLTSHFCLREGSPGGVTNCRTVRTYTRRAEIISPIDDSRLKASPTNRRTPPGHSGATMRRRCIGGISNQRRGVAYRPHGAHAERIASSATIATRFLRSAVGGTPLPRRVPTRPSPGSRHPAEPAHRHRTTRHRRRLRLPRWLSCSNTRWSDQRYAALRLGDSVAWAGSPADLETGQTGAAAVFGASRFPHVDALVVRGSRPPARR